MLLPPFVSPMPKPRRPAPLSLRLTPEDRQRLEADAAGMSLGSYIRSRLFDSAGAFTRTRGKTPVRDHQVIATLLARLGSSGSATSLAELADAARSGSLVLTPEIEAGIDRALSDIAAMRSMLVTALGLEDRP